MRNLKDSNIRIWWKEISVVSKESDEWYHQVLDGNSIDSVDTLCERITDYFIALKAGFSPLSAADVCDIVCDVVPNEFLVSSREAVKALKSIKIKKSPQWVRQSP